MSDRPSLLHCTLSFANVVRAGATASVLLAGTPSGAQAVDLLNGQGGGGASAAAAAQAAAQAQSQAAQQAAQHSIDMLGRATQAIQNMRSAQDAARALAAQTRSTVPNGLLPGGLVVDPRVGAANDASNLWVNAKLPTQASGSDGKVTVTIEQQAQRALMTWQEFNVGRDTTVHFDQSAGNSANGNDWIALNRIDATGVPSQILGQIKAEGTVVLINPNGVIFNGTSQVNVHSLIAAAMDMNSFSNAANGAFKASGDAYVPIIVGDVTQTKSDGTTIMAPSDEANANKTFLANGLFINSAFRLPGTFTSTGPSALFSAGLIPGQTNAGILVEAGARVVTDVSGSDNGGYVALLGPQVTNAGSIETKAGSIIMAAASSVLVAVPAANSTQTAYAVRTNGNGFPYGLVYSPPVPTEVARAVNSGLLISSRGNITVIGDAVGQLGIAEATTSITRAGSITLLASNEAVFGGGSLTTILPEHNGETIPSDEASLANFVAPRIDVRAPYVDFKGGSLVYAPSATMTVTGPETANNPDGSPPLPSGRVLMEAGSTIDLSGLTAYRSVADYIFTFKVTGNDVADTPLAKSLIGETVTIDLSLTGTRADGETWVGSPLFASSGAGYLANISQGIDQLLTKGGTLSFGPGTTNIVTAAFLDVLQAPGAVVNVSGGTVQYTGAAINTTQLLGSDGRTYDIGKADPFITYQGFAGTYTVDHSRWGYKDVYANHLYSGSYYKAAHTNGLSAGGVAVTAVNPILEGDLVGDIVIGTQQRQLAQVATGTGGVQLTPDQLPNGPSLSIGLVPYGGRTAVILDNTAPDYIGSDTTLTSPLALPTAAYDDTVAVLTLSTDRLSGYKLGSLTINDNDMLSMTADAHLSLRDGGSVKLGNVTTIDGTITAHGGSITISGVKSIKGVELPTSELTSLVIGSTALLDVSGRWINDTGHYGDDYTGALYIDGGSVSLTSYALSWITSYDPETQTATAEDRSASILLQKGSVIDVSSGGYVGPSGKLAFGSDGLGKGEGGNLSLLTYAGGSSAGRTDLLPQYAQFVKFETVATHGNVVMDGTIYAGGLSQGGTLTLQVPEIVINGEATQVTLITPGDQAGTMVLPTSFFTDSGFGSYKLTSTYGSTTVAAGTTLTLKQQNYLASSVGSLPATGARVRDFASLGYAPDGMRHAVDLALTQRTHIAGVDGDRSATAKVLIDEGASIVADPKAYIPLTKDGSILANSQAKITLTAGGPAVILGSITAHGGSITVQGGSIPMIQSPTDTLPHDGLPPYVWIGENAVLDVSGTFVPNPLVTAYDTGTVLPGGSISLSSVGVVVALKGSLFDISGASGTVEVPTAAGIVGPQIATRQVWSNGGSLTATASGYLGGTIKAYGGAPQAAGGTLNIGGEVIVSQSGDVAADFAAAGLPATRTQLGSLVPTLLVPGASTPSFITADTINTANSGLDTVSFSGPLYFSGNVDLKVAGSILIDVGRNALTLLPAGVIDRSYTATCPSSDACIPSIGAANVTLEAGYIRFASSQTSSRATSLNVPALADGTLTLEAAQQIDLVGVLAANNAGTVNLVSGGDIRLIGTYNFGSLVATDSGGGTAVSDGYGGMPYAGALLVADNLNLSARTIYPATDTAYLLMSLGLVPADAAGTHNIITVASNGKAPVAPQSAGGAVIVDARKIVQGGALYAPLGTIQLGLGAGQTLPSMFINGPTNNPYNPVNLLINGGGLYGYEYDPNGSLITSIATDSVTLLPGSITSVSANGLMIPYGTTTDGTDWTDNNTILNGPPTKLIALGGSTIDTQAGAIIDGSGGGDVYATEFVPGTGGSRNVLTTSTQTVYALVPGYGSGLAPYDASFTTKVAAGTTVTLPGGNGIAGGTYTLLPAEYATLPGAYRVLVASTNASPYAQTFTTADGSIYMTGVLGNAINGSASSQTALLQIQANSVWTRYSQIDIAKGSSYFAALATTKGTAVPRLAQDAARLVVAAASSLTLNADNRFDPASGGLGGQLDITGTNLVVAASDVRQGLLSSGDYSGYLVLDADILSGLGIESTLIGGYRSNTSEGTLITATALNLEIATDAAHPLSGPDLLFTSLAPTSADPSVRGLVVDDGSVILASGTVSGTDRSALVIGVDPVATKNNQTGAIMWWSTGVSGDGTLLRVSNGALANVVRHFVPGVYQTPPTTPAPTPPESSVALANLTIGANVALSGKSLTLDSSGATSLATSASLIAKNYDLAGGIINLGGGSGGLVITTDLIGQFAGADSVRLRSASVFNLYGDNSFGDGSNRIGTLTLDGAGLYSDGGTTTITAGNIVLASSQATANTNDANTSGSGGSLVLDANGTLTFGKGTKTLSGFTSVTATAGSEALFTGKGSLDAKDASVSLTAPLVLADKAASQSLKTTGLLTLGQGAGTAPAIAPTLIGGALSFTGGAIDASGTLIAQGGKLALEALTGDLTMSGNAVLNAAGTRITIGDLIQDTPAGSIRLYADAGNVTLGSGTTVDVSGSGSGYAGSLAVYAAEAATLAGTLKGGARYSDLGGTFALISDRLVDGMPINAGFTRSFQVSLGHGDLAIGVGQTLKSENVLLVANSGGITIDGTIDASSASGGTIGLYGAGTSTASAGTSGASGVNIGSNAKLYARYQAPDKNSPGYGDGTSTNVQRGGTITLGTTGTPDGTLDPTYGYQNVPGSGAVTVASGATFDVSGGPGGDSIDNMGGSVIVRAPILTNHDINVSFNGTVVTNAKADGEASGSPLVANAFAVWSTTDASSDPNKHFDGIIDPAGFFDATGTQIITADADGLYPTSTADTPAPGAYAPHVNFYQKTLLDFVNNPFDANAVAARFTGARLKIGANAETPLPDSALHLRPEIDLVNPHTSINNGNITVASNWNFGAGSLDDNGNVNLFYRTTDGGEPGTLTLRAANNVKINATITDGFFELYEPFGGDPATAYARFAATNTYAAYLNMFSDGSLVYNGNIASDLYLLGTTRTAAASAAFFGISEDQFNALQFYLQAPTVIAGDASVNDQYEQYYAQYVSLFGAYVSDVVNGNMKAASAFGLQSGWGAFVSYADATEILGNWETLPSIPVAPTLASTYYNIESGAQPGSGTDYVSLWQQYFFSLVDLNLRRTSERFYQGPGSLSRALGGRPAKLGNVSGLEAQYCLVCYAVTPPSAPPSYTTLQPGYVASTSAPPAPVPADQIANNPTTDRDRAVYNTTSSANLMTTAVSGKGSFSYDFVGGAEFNADGASSVNPNAVVRLASLNDTVTGNVTIDGHTTYINPFTVGRFPDYDSRSVYNNLDVVVPTLVRTGTGSITVAAAGDFALLDHVAPGAIYTAGHVADNANGFSAPTLTSVAKSSGLVTTPVWATGGGDITVTAGRDIVGFETPVDPTGRQFSNDALGDYYSVGVSTGQFWSSWYFVNGKSTGSATAPFDPSAGGEQYSSWVNYGSFFQGFGALGGGNITLKAGRNVQDVSASLPGPIQVSGGQLSGGAAAVAHYYGGGNLLVEAGNDVLSGVYYVGRGTGLIRAGGEVVADAALHETIFYNDIPTIFDYWSYTPTPEFSIPLLLAVQDSQIRVQAAGDITLGGIFDPTNIPADYERANDGSLPANVGAAFMSYGADSGVSLLSSTGAISVGAGASDTLFTHSRFPRGGSSTGAPANLSVTALTGDISIPSGVSLYASPSSDLSLVAGGSIDVGTHLGSPAGVTMGDGNTAIGSSAAALTAPLHSGDDVPVIIYAGEDINGGNYTLLKKARMWAGRDILDVTFTGMNTSDDDVTSIVASRDILASLRPSALGERRQARRSLFTLYGPGDLVIEAGRNLGPFSTYDAASIAESPEGRGGGIFAVGNGANYNTGSLSSVVKSYLPQEGADITLRYGVGGGIDYAGAIAKFGDAATAATSGIDIVSGIIPDLEKLLAGLIAEQAKEFGIANPSVTVTLTPAEAADLFTSLPTLAINSKLSALAEKAGLSGLTFDLTPTAFLSLIQAQEAMKVQIDHGFLGLLAQVGLDYKGPSSPYYGQYARAYEAIATLYPASLGYTDNSDGGSGAAPEIKHTGDLRMARSLVETQTGGDIDILGPGGNLYVGSNSAGTLTPAQQGILTLAGGSVRTYTDGSVLIYQSRIFTEQGGNVEMFSANGDLNAGKGPKSSAAYPPLKLICDTNGYCRVNPAGLVTGAGIGALLSVPGQDPSKSNVILSAPHGVIDFGAAGVRTAGDLSVIAPVVLNAFNAQVGGTATGVPTFQAPDVGGMTQASNTSAGAVSDAAAGAGQQAPSEQPSIIIVEVIGYGGGDSEPDASSMEKNKNEIQQRQNEPGSSSEDQEERKKKKQLQHQ